MRLTSDEIKLIEYAIGHCGPLRWRTKIRDAIRAKLKARTVKLESPIGGLEAGTEITAGGGLLWVGEKSLPCLLADQVAHAFGYQHAEEMVVALQAHAAGPELVQRARDEWVQFDDLNIDDDAECSVAEDGTWVQAWVWLPRG